MKQIKTSTGIIRVLDFGTYYGTCAAENFFDDDNINDDFNEGYCDYTAEEFWENFDNKLYMEKLVELGATYMKHYVLPDLLKLNIGIIDIKVDGYYSPREYNFSTDELNFTIEVEDDFQDRVISIIKGLEGDALASYKQYLKDHCTSRDGFVSLVSNDISSVLDDIAENVDCREMDCFLDWYFSYNVPDLYDTDEMQWYYFLQDNLHSHTDFIDPDYKPYSKVKRELEEKVIDIAQDMYREHSVEQVVQHILDNIEVPEALEDMTYTGEYNRFVEKAVTDVFLNIDKKSLTLF